MYRVELEVRISSINLGIKEGSKPEEDRHQYLEVDEFDVHITEKGFFIHPKKWHTKEYPVTYCNDCLKEGKKILAEASSSTKELTVGWCKEHYRLKERKINPCPVCDEGYMVFGTCDMHCSHCNYREPHVHDVRRRFDGIFAVAPQLSPVKPEVDVMPHFMCTCMDWETTEDHNRRRATLKKVVSTV